jgi:hypothetical protein
VQQSDADKRIRYLQEETDLFSYLVDLDTVKALATKAQKLYTSKNKSAAAAPAPAADSTAPKSVIVVSTPTRPDSHRGGQN